jgi:hypothetical protein
MGKVPIEKKKKGLGWVFLMPYLAILEKIKDLNGLVYLA